MRLGVSNCPLLPILCEATKCYSTLTVNLHHMELRKTLYDSHNVRWAILSNGYCEIEES